MRTNHFRTLFILFLAFPVLVAVSSASQSERALQVDSGVSNEPITEHVVWAKQDRAAPRDPDPAEPTSYLKPLAEELNKTWPKNRTINIVVHGHSVPAGYFKTPRVDTFNSYPHLVHVGLNERYPTAVINIITTAIGGEASPAGAKRFERDVLPHRPDLLLIDYGLNDRRQGLEKAEAAWRMMIETALEHEIPVLLLTPTAALKAKMDDPQDPLNQHAELIRALAKEYGVALADSTAAFQQAVAEGAAYTDFMSHPVHPNRRGHDLVAEQILEWFPL